MNAGTRPFCNARSAARMVAGPEAALFREWQAFGLTHYGWPFIADGDTDTMQAPFIGTIGSIDQGVIR